MATVAADEGVWLHVDGAYGAPAAADPASRRLFAGLHRADSLCIDAHKWLYAPVDCSALLLHDAAATARAFGAGADDYVRVLATQPAETFAFWDHGLELSRRFRALKLWATLRFYGARRLAAAVGEDIRAAAHLAELVVAAEDFELLAGPGLSICCFRHAPPHARRGGARRPQRAGAAGAAAGRSRLSVQRDHRRALRPPGLHHELPHDAGGCRAGADGRARAGVGR